MNFPNQTYSFEVWNNQYFKLYNQKNKVKSINIFNRNVPRTTLMRYLQLAVILLDTKRLSFLEMIKLLGHLQ